MSKPENDPGIEHEPHLHGGALPADPSEAKTDGVLEREGQRGGQARQAAMQSVAEESFDVSRTDPKPAAAGAYCARCGYDLRGVTVREGCPECGFDLSGGYKAYLRERIENTTTGDYLLALLFALLSGGVLSVIGTFVGQGLFGKGVGLTVLAVTGPLFEELMKVMVVLMLIELRPYLFRHAAGIWVAALGSAATFAVLENLLYLGVYIPDPSPGLILWRWTVCSALHIGCTAITTIGLVRMWRRSIDRLEPPSPAVVYPFMVAAIVVHGLYNAVAVFAELAGVSF